MCEDAGCCSYGYDSQASLDWLINDFYDSRPRRAGALQLGRFDDDA